MPAPAATWYCRLSCRSRSQRSALPRPSKMGMRGNVSSTSLSGKRKTLQINNLDQYPGSRQATLYYLTARLDAARVVGGDNKYSKGAPILRVGTFSICGTCDSGEYRRALEDIGGHRR